MGTQTKEFNTGTSGVILVVKEITLSYSWGKLGNAEGQGQLFALWLLIPELVPLPPPWTPGF